MTEEDIIRDEANQFYEWSMDLESHEEPIVQFQKVKERLFDFYSPSAKSIFLDQIKIHVIENLQKHRDEKHNGEADPKCGWENQAEKLLYYIKQEVESLPAVVNQKIKSTNKDKRKKVFVSYSHADENYLKDIRKYFKPFLKEIDFWDDSRIQPGEKWKKEIKLAIDETKVAILLVSTDFLASDFIATDELPPLLEAAEKEGAIILTVILRPCLFDMFDDLKQYQTMNPPSLPVSKMDNNEVEELYVNLVKQTKQILDKENGV